MWVLFDKTYVGPQGFFPAGQKKDLPQSTLELISEDFWQETCAPWEELRDPKAQHLAELKDKVTRLKQSLDTAESQYVDLQTEADEFDKQIAKSEDACTPAEQSREGRVAACEYDILKARYEIAVAKAVLKQIEGEDIAEELATAESGLKTITDQATAEKAKADAEAKTKSKAESEQAEKAKADSKSEAERIKAAEKEGWDDCNKMITSRPEPALRQVDTSAAEPVVTEDNVVLNAPIDPEDLKLVTDPNTTIPQLRELAAKRKIDLGKTTLKHDIVSLIEAAYKNNLTEKTDNGPEQTNVEAQRRSAEGGTGTDEKSN